jgi:fructokinase
LATVVCLGEALIDFVADVTGVTLEECPGFRKAAGGAPANVAAGLARLGVPVAFAGKVGEDPFGRFLEHTLSAAGVDTSPMRFDLEARTGLAFVSLMANGERDFVFFRHPSADMRLRPEELPSDLFAEAQTFHFGSISLIGEPSRSATLAAARAARERGCLVSYDPNLRLPLWPSPEAAREQALAAMPLADLVKVSVEEVEFLLGGSPRDAARMLLKSGPRLVNVTAGADGCEAFWEDRSLAVPGFHVPVVDTTGAGDGWVAGFIASLLEYGIDGGRRTADDRRQTIDGGRPAEAEPSIVHRSSSIVPIPHSEAELERALRFANAVGALTCTRKGAIPALPGHEAVESLLQERGGGGGGCSEPVS